MAFFGPDCLGQTRKVTAMLAHSNLPLYTCGLHTLTMDSQRTTARPSHIVPHTVSYNLCVKTVVTSPTCQA